jgi:hypothetical protein
MQYLLTMIYISKGPINFNHDIIFRRIWEKEISDTLNNRPNKRSSYVILRSGQLVGTALVIYAKADIVSNIRNVEYVMKKVRSFFSIFSITPVIVMIY